MGVLYRLTSEMRKKLKAPIGTLIQGSFSETMKALNDLVREESPSTIISVGDRVSKSLEESRISTHLFIVDNKIMRKPIQPVALEVEEVLYTENPPGTITRESVTAIQEGITRAHSVKIVVDGEEDLLTLIAVLYAPERAFVVYGQPREGVVVVRADKQKRMEVEEILKAMETPRKTK